LQSTGGSSEDKVRYVPHFEPAAFLNLYKRAQSRITFCLQDFPGDHPPQTFHTTSGSLAMLAAIRRACIIRLVAAREESVHSAPHRQRLRLGMITDDAELEAAQKAQTVLIALSPSTPSSEAVVSQMRNAAQLAAKAAEHNFSSEAELNNVRAEAGLALIGVIGGLEDGSLTEGALRRGRDAVRAWIGKLVAR
jgi:hypothetical protein